MLWLLYMHLCTHVWIMLTLTDFCYILKYDITLWLVVPIFFHFLLSVWDMYASEHYYRLVIRMLWVASSSLPDLSKTWMNKHTKFVSLPLSHNLNVEPQDLVLWHFCIISHLFQVQGLGPFFAYFDTIKFCTAISSLVSTSFTVSSQFVIPHSFCWASQHVISLACSVKLVCSRMLCALHFPLIFSFKFSLWKCITHSSSHELHLSCLSSSYLSNLIWSAVIKQWWNDLYLV